jgi:hypothetical protein
VDIWEILGQLLPYYPWIIIIILFIFVVLNWKKLKFSLCDIYQAITEFRKNLHFTRKVNSAIQGSFRVCRKFEPIMGAFGKIILIQIKIKKNVQDIQLIREEGIVTAIIPARNMDNVVKALTAHFSENLSNFSNVRDYPKLERALEIVSLQLVIEKCNLDGALEVSLKDFLNKMKENEEIKLICNILVDLNSKLKRFETRLDRRLLRILLIETCRAELNVLGKTLL